MLAGELSEYLNRTGSVIVMVTLMFLAVIISTQFSFGRFFALAVRRDARRSAGAGDRVRGGARNAAARKQRREVIAKHTKKDSGARSR